MRPLADIKDTSSIPSIEKLETASSVASGGRFSVPDSAEDALEVALKEKNTPKGENNSEKDDIPLSVNNSAQREFNDSDEKEDLFKPSGDDDLFFKVQTNKNMFTSQNSRDPSVNSQKQVNGEGHRNSFIPSPSPVSNDSNLLNVNQSDIKRENSISSLSCDFSSGEEIQNSPGNPVVLSSGCDTFCPSDSFLASDTVDKNSAITEERNHANDVAIAKDVQER